MSIYDYTRIKPSDIAAATGIDASNISLTADGDGIAIQVQVDLTAEQQTSVEALFRPLLPRGKRSQK